MSYIQHLESLPETELANLIDSRVADTCHRILNEVEFASAAGGTNAVDWTIDEYEVTDVEFSDNEVIVRLTYSASGEQMDDHVFAGDRIDGEAEMVIDAEGRVAYRDVTAEVSDGAAWEGDEVDA